MVYLEDWTTHLLAHYRKEHGVDPEAEQRLREISEEGRLGDGSRWELAAELLWEYSQDYDRQVTMIRLDEIYRYRARTEGAPCLREDGQPTITIHHLVTADPEAVRRAVNLLANGVQLHWW